MIPGHLFLCLGTVSMAASSPASGHSAENRAVSCTPDGLSEPSKSLIQNQKSQPSSGKLLSGFLPLNVLIRTA